MVSAIIADGYLLKKKRDDRRNFLASKYQRRYFELTADTLAYAKDPRELKDGGGDIEVFAIHELKYIKKLEDCKLEMKFPERVLRVKAESIKEHDRWYEAIKDARQKKLDGNNTPQAKQLETLKEQTKQQMMTTLEEDSDDDQPTVAAATVKKPDLQLAPINTRESPNPVANNNRPPSPRSLLANPRMGTKMIAPTTRKNQQEEEEVETLQVAPKPRSRWQDEEEEEEEEVAQQQQKQQQQPVQPQHRVSGGNGKQPPPPAAAAPPSSERLMLNANQEPLGGGAKGGGTAGRGARADVPQAAPRGEKLQLGDAGRQAAVAAPAVTAAPLPAKGPSRENAEKLSLGGPTAPVTGSRGNTPPTGGHASGTDAAAPIESAREEWEDDDWDSSDDDDDRKRAAASAAATAATAGRARPSQSSTSGRPGDASGSGRPAARGSGSNGGPAAAAPPGDEAAGSSETGPRRVPGDDKALRGTSTAAGPGAAARKSSDRGSMGQQLPHAGYEAIKTVPGAQPAKGKALQPSPRQQQRQEEEDKEAALAKHAAGTDHLEDNWDSEEEEEEMPRKPQGRPVPPAPLAPSPRDSTVKTNGPQRRIPGPPPTAPAAARPTPPMTAPHALTTGIARPPTAPKQPAVGPTPSGPGARPRGRISSEDGLPPQPPAKAAGGSSSSGGGGSATARNKLEIGEPAPLRSNVVHDPNVKPDDNNWVEEDWDDDD
ncbi:hypothetical protein Vretimale_10227 [Volvox reticuliferus]|uniref:PH domain-containing protein n=1 Tax=Volvox reticuliferus TaxID=1737510 RepID=A0A8J4FGD3_9CHLO|nr:hypothetical protein Vretifemale_734 [Volvox reticuliferus]GIM05756.1 hypothetical protein Vretimale_10227 [Volvox reticuliferus]